MSPLQRREDWPEQLAAFIESRLHTPFAWGTNDCAVFAADAVLAITGTDLAGPWRGQYADETGAVVAAQDSLNTLVTAGEIVAALHDLAGRNLGPAVPPLMARRGDVVLVEHDAGYSLAVCVGPVAAAPGRRGVVMVERAAWRYAWRVG